MVILWRSRAPQICALPSQSIRNYSHCRSPDPLLLASALRITKLLVVVECGEARFRTRSRLMTANPVWAERQGPEKISEYVRTYHIGLLTLRILVPRCEYPDSVEQWVVEKAHHNPTFSAVILFWFSRTDSVSCAAFVGFYGPSSQRNVGPAGWC